MVNFRRCLLVLILFAATPAFAVGDAEWLYRGSDIARDPAWTFGTLPNGVRYVVRRNALPAGQVSIRLRIDAGSLHEGDAERGYAHFTEHMAFRGTRSFADREARHIWQTLGASFGSDSNAFTEATQTVYQLDLPKNDRASLATSLKVIAEMADSALFDPATVAAERKIVLAEKGRRPELSTRFRDLSQPLFYAGLKYATRDPIGTDATLAAADATKLRAFYERWYRPERATVIMVGDADPAEMERLIAEAFAGWKPETPSPAEPDYGAVAAPPSRTVALTYPGAPHSASVAWLRPYLATPNTKANEQADLATSLGTRIINRRLEARARGDAAFLNAGISQNESINVADVTSLSVTARGGRWHEALQQSFAVISDAVAMPPSEAEIARELRNLRTAALAGLEAESTIQSQQRAQQMVSAVDDRNTVSTARTLLALLDEVTPAMTPTLVGNAMRGLFAGSGPRLLVTAPEPIDAAAAETALAAAEQAAPATRLAERAVSFDNLPPLGTPGREVSRRTIDDMGVTIVGFADGATLTFKRTDFDKGTVAVQLRFGGGLAAVDPARAELGWTTSVIGPSGLADLDLDALERLMTGRRIGLTFGVAEDAFVLRGVTNGQEIGDQLRLMAAKLAFPRWDAALFERYRAGSLEAYDLSFASASARARREFGGYTRGNDGRWAPTERAHVTDTTLAQARAYFDPLLAQGPIEAIVVGDVDLETVVQAMARTIGALPRRSDAAPTPPQLAVRPPAPNPAPKTFTHRGDPNQAYAAIGWTSFGGTDRLKERRALSLAANILQVRLFDRLREEEGASYSPNAISSTSEPFTDWGIFYAAAEIRPESANTFFRIAREIIADLAAQPVAPDEFERAQNPVLSGIERRVRTNGYWVQSLENWIRKPELVAATRSFLADYRAMTAEDVRRAVATHVAEGGDWSMLVLPAKESGGGT